MSALAVSPGPKLQFSYNEDALAYAETSKSYASTHLENPDILIGTGALVFDTTKKDNPQILLLQRATSDSMPNKWEVPGGGCDADDPSILHAVARELWEEAGLEASHISAPVGEPHFFKTRSGKQICKLNFLVLAERHSEGSLQVKLDAKEHQNFLWASEDEVKSGKIKDFSFDITSQGLIRTILIAFGRIKLGDWPKAAE